MAEIKTDCFGYHKGVKECRIMTETICRKRKCTFYKTQKEYMEGLKKHPMKESSKK